MGFVRTAVLLALVAVLVSACTSSRPEGSATTPTAPAEASATASVTAVPSAPAATPSPAAATATAVPPTAIAGSGIAGVASVGPTCPVQRIDSPCPDRPFQGTIVVRDPDGTEVARTQSDAAGAFSFALPPGSYVVLALVNGPFPLSKPVQVTVTPGAVTTVELKLDSGIR